ncbi:MAG: hypothetical protein KGL17_06250 [Betaproteobacteria bacterium]|nr:hypothetical protein [Betaproteobacteria bacterium]
MVKVNGAFMPGWTEWEVQNNSHYQADTFRVSFALSRLPAQYDAAWWASQTSITIEVLAGFPSDPSNFSDSQLVSWIYGNVDEVEFSPAGGIVTVSGRDLTALLIDTKTTEDFRSQTSSQIAQTLAGRHGLGTDYIVGTGTLAGLIYELDRVQFNHERTEWSLLCYLAGKEEFQVFVSGRDLHFEPRNDPSSVTPYLLRWERPRSDRAAPAFNGTQLSFTRNLTVARGISVTVRSWQAKQKTVIKSVYPKPASGITPGSSTQKGGVQSYVFTRPGLNQAQADAFAQAKHRELTRHEMKLRATLPADDLLAVDSVISVDGTGSQFDQSYFPDTVTRRMSASEGYTMTVSAKNHNADSETQP